MSATEQPYGPESPAAPAMPVRTGVAALGPQRPEGVITSVTRKRLCASCHKPLTKGRRRFCSDGCARQGRQRRVKDNTEYLEFMSRAIRGAERRVVAEDPSTLAAMIKLRGVLDKAIDAAARSLHDQGWSWGEIAYEIGIPRQDAWRKWGKDRG